MNNKAYLFVEYSLEELATLDIGIGYIPYVEPRLSGCIVIAPDEKRAMELVNIQTSIDEWLKTGYPPYGHLEDADRLFMCICEQIMASEQVIDGETSTNEHWLCHLVQYNDAIAKHFRYAMNFDWEPVYPYWWNPKSTYAGYKPPALSWTDLSVAHITHEDEPDWIPV